ncbi:imelysin family protein [Pseudoroseicyclus tamaricis]|uniref:Imelysin family protein n=1 Tax=Pseudoroseicyclus tamaricis TaxID=2705421 RepID=A0A6B2JI46_9RHOB|nr:imelysin family protein [Pseudoroseicyclus tamaricis]NDV01021.1 imelysin family protein [Pseudoroseicyclus tamaricis]
MIRAILAAACLATPACADEAIDRAVEQVILPAVADFADRTEALAEAAEADCTPLSPVLRAAWEGAMEGWLMVQDFRFGPLEATGLREAIAYWPDTRGFRPRALNRALTTATGPQSEQDMAGAPISLRGLYAIEAMLFDPRFNTYGAGEPGCDLVRLMAADLAGNAALLEEEWEDFAPLLQGAEAGNATYFNAAEARQALFTGLVVSMQFDMLERLGLPLGTGGEPRPELAESRVSGRTLQNIIDATRGHEALALALTDDPATRAELAADFDDLRERLRAIDDPVLANVSEPAGRFMVDVAATAYTAVWTKVNRLLSEELGVTMGVVGFDGD